MPRIKAYEIGAIFEVGMFEYDNTLVFMPLEAAQLYFQLEGRANELEIMVADPDRVADYRARARSRWSAMPASWSTGSRPTPRSSPRSRSSAT